MFYYLYQITNLVNNKIYVGMHRSESLDNNYMGSGKLIQRAIAKHGVDKFKKEILAVFDNESDMKDAERNLVNEEFLSRPDVYNLCPGGMGGFGYINKNKDEKYYSNRIKNGFKTATIYNSGLKVRPPSILTNNSNRAKKLSILGHIILNKKYPNGTFFEKKHTIESIHKMKLSHCGLQSGYKNSQYGSMWITNGVDNKKIKKQSKIPAGWYRGRKM